MAGMQLYTGSRLLLGRGLSVPLLALSSKDGDFSTLPHPAIRLYKTVTNRHDGCSNHMIS
jgi:hypothetical protein